MEHVFVCVAGSSVLGIEIDSYRKSAVLDDLIHCECRIVDVAREAVCIPAEHDIALVGIDRTEHAVDAADTELMLECVSCKCCVVSFDVHLEVFIKTVISQESDSCCSVVIVLVLHRFLRLRLDKECAVKSDAPAVITGDLH